jgi:hypothetical protein
MNSVGQARLAAARSAQHEHAARICLHGYGRSIGAAADDEPVTRRPRHEPAQVAGDECIDHLRHAVAVARGSDRNAALREREHCGVVLAVADRDDVVRRNAQLGQRGRQSEGLGDDRG